MSLIPRQRTGKAGEPPEALSWATEAAGWPGQSHSSMPGCPPTPSLEHTMDKPKTPTERARANAQLAQDILLIAAQRKLSPQEQLRFATQVAAAVTTDPPK